VYVETWCSCSLDFNIFQIEFLYPSSANVNTTDAVVKAFYQNKFIDL
jgi:hypothetical protein